jgi:hypothetical protein
VAALIYFPTYSVWEFLSTPPPHPGQHLLGDGESDCDEMETV